MDEHKTRPTRILLRWYGYPKAHGGVWMLWLALVEGLAALVATAALLEWARPRIVAPWKGLGPVTVVSICLFVAARVLYLRRVARVRRLLEEADYQLCVNCGYRLVSESDDVTCPECGTPLHLPDVRRAWMGAYGPRRGRCAGQSRRDRSADQPEMNR